MTLRVSVHRYSTRLSSVRCAGGGAAKPGWLEAPQQRWGPELPDKQYFWDHSTYTGLTLWLRGVRPYLEQMGETFMRFSRDLCGRDSFLGRLQSTLRDHNPDLRFQLIAFGTFALTARTIGVWLNSWYQKVLDTRHAESLDEARRLQSHGFWMSESEDLDCRVQQYSVDHDQLNALWSAAVLEATEEENANKGFELLCRRLCSGLQYENELNSSNNNNTNQSSNFWPTSSPDDFAPVVAPDQITMLADKPQQYDAHALGSRLQLQPPITWRFNMIPYGHEVEDTRTFPIPDQEQPHRAFALNFTYNNLAYDWGDYINRKDNKNALMRPARIMFTDIYVPPTK